MISTLGKDVWDWLLLEVCRSRSQHDGIVSEKADSSIAALAQQATDAKRSMAVVDVKESAAIAWLRRSANCATAVLLRQHGRVDVFVHPVLAQIAKSLRAPVVLAAELFAQVRVSAIGIVPATTSFRSIGSKGWAGFGAPPLRPAGSPRREPLSAWA
jgi:hypothetical protein